MLGAISHVLKGLFKFLNSIFNRLADDHSGLVMHLDC